MHQIKKKIIPLPYFPHVARENKGIFVFLYAEKLINCSVFDIYVCNIVYIDCTESLNKSEWQNNFFSVLENHSIRNKLSKYFKTVPQPKTIFDIFFLLSKTLCSVTTSI